MSCEGGRCLPLEATRPSYTMRACPFVCKALAHVSSSNALDSLLLLPTCSYDDGLQTMTVRLRNGPVGAALTGSTQVGLVQGVADFVDVGITHRGAGMVLEFECTYGGFTVTSPVDVLFSSEFQVGHTIAMRLYETPVY